MAAPAERPAGLPAAGGVQASSTRCGSERACVIQCWTSSAVGARRARRRAALTLDQGLMQRARILAREAHAPVDAEQLEHVGEDRADALDPGQVGPAGEALQQRRLDAAAGGQLPATAGAPDGLEQLIGVGDALTLEPGADPVGHASQLADVQRHGAEGLVRRRRAVGGNSPSGPIVRPWGAGIDPGRAPESRGASDRSGGIVTSQVATEGSGGPPAPSARLIAVCRHSLMTGHEARWLPEKSSGRFRLMIVRNRSPMDRFCDPLRHFWYDRRRPATGLRAPGGPGIFNHQAIAPPPPGPVFWPPGGTERAFHPRACEERAMTYVIPPPPVVALPIRDQRPSCSRCTASTASAATTPSTRARWATIPTASRRSSSRRPPTPWSRTAARSPIRPRPRTCTTRSSWSSRSARAARDIAADEALEPRLRLCGRPRHDAARPAGRSQEDAAGPGRSARPSTIRRRARRWCRRARSAIRRAARSGSRSTASAGRTAISRR